MQNENTQNSCILRTRDTQYEFTTAIMDAKHRDTAHVQEITYSKTHSTTHVT